MTSSYADSRTSHDTTAMERLTIIGPVVQRASGQRSAPLSVDQDHPFFFDHPLDHVPGILLVTGLLDIVRASADPYLGARTGRGRVRLSLSFARMCELDSRVMLFAEPDPDAPDDGWAVRATQDDATVCSGTVGLVRRGDQLPRWPERGEQVTPIRPDLVHRVDQRNVVLAEPRIATECYDVPLVTPPAGHFLRRHGEQRYGVEEIIESGRQLLTAAGQLAHERPDSRMLWITLTADLPAGAVRSVPLALRWPVCPPRGNVGTFDFTVVTHGTGQPVGTLSYVIKYCTPAAYQRLRGTGARR